jgi:tRNA pseudouridine38-40 synthase
MFNHKLLLAYEGTHYLGWQRTKMGPSIEEALEKALFQIFHSPILLQAASRTDAGVHAKGQVVNFFLKQERDLDRLQRSLNALLPSDISVLKIERVAPSFHPTLDVLGKEYRYFVCNSNAQLPFHRTSSWHFPYPLNIDKMRSAAVHLIGTKDFSAFSNVRIEKGIRTLTALTIDSIEEGRLSFSIQGDHFLYKMVRNLVGTLVYVGCGKIKEEELPAILESRERARAGITAPAHGLTLYKVFYTEMNSKVGVLAMPAPEI